MEAEELHGIFQIVGDDDLFGDNTLKKSERAARMQPKSIQYTPKTCFEGHFFLNLTNCIYKNNGKELINEDELSKFFNTCHSHKRGVYDVRNAMEYLYARKRFDLVYQIGKKNTELQPKYSYKDREMMDMMARCCVHLGHFDEAVFYVEKINIQEPGYWVVAAETYRKTGNVKKAFKTYQDYFTRFRIPDYKSWKCVGMIYSSLAETMTESGIAFNLLALATLYRALHILLESLKSATSNSFLFEKLEKNEKKKMLEEIDRLTVLLNGVARDEVLKLVVSKLDVMIAKKQDNGKEEAELEKEWEGVMNYFNTEELEFIKQSFSKNYEVEIVDDTTARNM